MIKNFQAVQLDTLWYILGVLLASQQFSVLQNAYADSRCHPFTLSLYGRGERKARLVW